ncbi:mannose-1-phosphate guanylyltransferase [Myxococcota bacterium]
MTRGSGSLCPLMGVDDDIQVVALGGGSGTRFWPVSRKARPKQLLRLGGDRTLLAATFERVRELAGPRSWWMVVGSGHAEACRRAVPETLDEQVLVEPRPRNTAPAIALAAAHIARRRPEATMVVLPADHTVGRPRELCAALRVAAAVAKQGGIVTLGIAPTHAETAYGYIQRGDADPRAEGAFKVERFLEKPVLERAEAFVAAGDSFWNAGIFVMRASSYLRELGEHLPGVRERIDDVARAVDSERYVDVLEEAYEEMQSISIDYGVMEQSASVAVVPVDCDWSDVGSWNAVSALVPPDADGNVVSGRAVVQDSRDCVIYANDDGHVIGVVGLEGLAVVHTGDATLVLPASRAQEVRGIVSALEKQGWNEYL